MKERKKVRKKMKERKKVRKKRHKKLRKKEERNDDETYGLGKREKERKALLGLGFGWLVWLVGLVGFFFLFFFFENQTQKDWLNQPETNLVALIFFCAKQKMFHCC
jgi:cytoskeletal protein RodZ